MAHTEVQARPLVQTQRLGFVPGDGDHLTEAPFPEHSPLHLRFWRVSIPLSHRTTCTATSTESILFQGTLLRINLPAGADVRELITGPADYVHPQTTAHATAAPSDVPGMPAVA